VGVRRRRDGRRLRAPVTRPGVGRAISETSA
jgi:hypothetical protein